MIDSNFVVQIIEEHPFNGWGDMFLIKSSTNLLKALKKDTP
jgi:hypothetical protein